MKTFAFVDASNLFYGGVKSLGWKIDYQKLFTYLQRKYGVEKILYFGGVEIYNFSYNYLENEVVPIEDLRGHLTNLLKLENSRFSDARILLLERHLSRVNFYRKLKGFGYELYLKPVKSYPDDEGNVKRKANCDVDMAFYLMKEKDNFGRAVILSGDGDFLPVLKFLGREGKEIFVLARGRRTAKEIRQFAAGNFRDFEYLKYLLKFDKKEM
ncbi:hypothetical protein COU03_00715 [bacterium (Candidatus Gribaldobacteria) CG10_big_fil_rev_8_21_14_0_10_41_12]|uniref:NYN domain-containing protein n=1 Tax=bacterium (Candidatus Gribaldobacteria) CG10_big_fil_rev_8_21_14_0_10_41_12 TaxID=2014277 RepID=A0A2H0UY07_9BACT|nr:MAG: hypothetical protein AUJ36_03930 [Parcubacteria group bacterium CG1_02_41_26]PIR91736.1 MAG: hypothetical protein COU03_00715 [bacterium (Candidatus Gribaldobacteria) CG10_big_fil_rev_8_21_14_0_10_41_12]